MGEGEMFRVLLMQRVVERSGCECRFWLSGVAVRF